MDLTELARVKALLDVSTSEYDTALTAMISAVGARFERFVGRPFESTSRTETYDLHPRAKEIFLRAAPVDSVSEVKIAPDWNFASATAVDSDDYNVDLRTGRLSLNYAPIRNYLGETNTTAPNVVQVTYTGGFAANTAALIAAYPDIAYAADVQVVAMWRRRDTPQGTSHSVGGSSVTYEAQLKLVQEARETLTSYRHLRFGVNG